MRKRFTKIICSALAVISASALIFVPGCSTSWKGVSGDKDTAAEAVEGTNGGFSVETENYVYFINGVSDSDQDNTFGSVVKGSIQRISKTDLNNYNYSNTVTVVPSVVYSGSYDAGIYIYGGYLYYTTPSTQRNTDGEILNSNLDFKRTKLDGTDTTDGYIWQSSDNSVDYRFVQVNGEVYILYALSENLYGTSYTNIHSVKCSDGTNTILAYNVDGYSFNTEDPTDPYVYYTMDVPEAMGSSSTLGYNQLYRVRADATESPRTYDYTDTVATEYEEGDDEYDPLYINLGDYVFDGIGIMRAGDKLTQFNYTYYQEDKTLNLSNSDYTYSIQWYKGDYVYYTRVEGNGETHLYRLANSDIDGDNDGKVDTTWNPVTANASQPIFVYEDYTTEYTFVTMDDKLYAVETSSDGIFKKTVDFDETKNIYTFGEEVKMSADASATVLAVREEVGHTYLYYSITGGNGYTVYRLAIDGEKKVYSSLLAEDAPDYKGVQILDLDASSDWYMPEFVGNVLMFAAEVEGMTDYNYIMACNLTNSEGTAIMTNAEIEAYNTQYEAITEKIEAYDDETNSDGTATYENLSGALKYQFYTRDDEYLEELIAAYVEIEERDEEYLYSEESVAIYKDFATCKNDWETWDNDGTETAFVFRTISGETVYSNTRDYYYSLLGKMSDDDAEDYLQDFKDDTSYMQAYPEDTRTWWDKLSTGGKVGFIIGMVAAGLAVIGGVTVLVIFLVKRHKKRKEEAEPEKKAQVDISDDSNVDVYGEDEEVK